MIINYAVQVCDTKSNQSIPRYATDNRTELSIKCLTSFINSVNFSKNLNPTLTHNITFFNDESSKELTNFISKLESVNIINIKSKNIMTSIRNCWKYLLDSTSDLIYLVQDDYLFLETAIFQIIDIFLQILNDTNSHAIVLPFHDSYIWTNQPSGYYYRPTPRAIIPGALQYWISCYDISCSFLTSKYQLINNWDLCEKFLNLNPNNPRLEADSLNQILTKRGVLGIMPFESVSLHLQSELEKDPYIDWKSRWNSITPIINGENFHV